MTAEIENVPMPEATPAAPKKRASRARTSRKAEAENKKASAGLLNALRFVGPAQRKAGTQQQMFSTMQNGWLIAFDGILLMATPIADPINACPQTYQLTNALAKCVDTFALAQVSETALAVVSGDFRALVECMPTGVLELATPDPQIAVIDNRIKAALECVMPLATDGAQKSMHAAVLLQANSAIATTGTVAMEYWHGIDLPPGMLLPKLSAQAIARCGKDLCGFGYSANSATFYCTDGSVIKTQLFEFKDYPLSAFERIFNSNDPAKTQPMPENFFTAVEHASLFGDKLSFTAKGVASFGGAAESEYNFAVPAPLQGMGFSSKLLDLCKHAMHTVEWQQESKRAIFFGENARGAIMGLNLETEEKPYEPPRRDDNPHHGHYDDMDDDIPF